MNLFCNKNKLLENFFLLICVLLFKNSIVNALKCKCTQNSPQTPCHDGICEINTGFSSCLMLDHPISGRHYACSATQLEEGECIEKITKSGVVVNVCPCNYSDYCNFKIWPSKSNDFDDESEEYDNFEQIRGASRRQISNLDNDARKSYVNSTISLFWTKKLIVLTQFCLILIFIKLVQF